MATSVPSAEASDPFADRRLYARTQLALPAFLQANGDRHSVNLLDLSAGGAKLKCPVSLTVGTAVILDCGTLGCAAVVRWQNGGVLGLCFDSPLDVRDVSALIDRSIALAARVKTRE
jgi:hypothetical protein